MQTLKIDMMKFTGAKYFEAKDGTGHIAIPLDPNNVFRGEKGLYCSLTLMDNRDGQDQYGNDGFVTVDLGKDRRLAGEKGPILGNWRHLSHNGPPSPLNAPSVSGYQNQPATPQNGAQAQINTRDFDEGDDAPF